MSKFEFNPVKEDKDGVKARRVIWSTKALDAAIGGLDEGRRLVANPFYDNNPRLLKSDLVFQRTREEIEETLPGFKEQYLPKIMTLDILEELFPYVQKVVNEDHAAL